MTQAMLSLLEHAQHQRDEALAAMLQAESALRQARQQLDQLQAYQSDYAARAPARGGRSASIELLRGHHAFMERLDQALALQQGQLQDCETQLQQRRQTLSEREIRVASVQKLLERRDQVQQRSFARQEQMHSDDATAQRRWHESSRQSSH